MPLRRRGRRRAEPGAATRRARPRGRRGQAARRRRAHPSGSTRATRGPATAPWHSLSHPLARRLALGHSVALWLRKEQREGEERESNRETELGFAPATASAGFYTARNERPAVGSKSTAQIRSGHRRPRRARAAAQLCRPRPTLRPGCGRAPRGAVGRADFGPRKEEQEPVFVFFFFQKN